MLPAARGMSQINVRRQFPVAPVLRQIKAKRPISPY
jgi:hypothetical protein